MCRGERETEAQLSGDTLGRGGVRKYGMERPGKWKRPVLRGQSPEKRGRPRRLLPKYKNKNTKSRCRCRTAHPTVEAEPRALSGAVCLSGPWPCAPTPRLCFRRAHRPGAKMKSRACRSAAATLGCHRSTMKTTRGPSSAEPGREKGEVDMASGRHSERDGLLGEGSQGFPSL